MNIHVLTLFPGMFGPVLSESIIKRARNTGKVFIDIHDIRDYSADKHRKVDDKPFGGGPGMVLQCQPVIDALYSIKKLCPDAKAILMSPKGRLLDHELCHSIAKEKSIILICGHYEGMDERIREHVSGEISIGDYILTGGELPAMVLVDCITRLVPGVLGHNRSNKDESFANGLLEYPHYTRPSDYKGKKVPDVLLSGNHNMVKKWRKQKSIAATIRHRPDLIKHVRQLEL